MNIISKHSNSNFAHHNGFYRSNFKVSIKRLRNSTKRSHAQQINTFRKILKAKKKVKRVSKFDKECLLFIFIYANSKFIVTSKNQDFLHVKRETV